MSNLQENRKNWIKFQCPVCASEFSKRLCEVKNPHAVYCSQQCAYKGRTLGFTKRTVTKPYNIVNSQEKAVYVDCVHCGITIRTIPALANRKKFCSKQCLHENQKTSSIGKNNPSWIDGRSYDKRCHRGHNWEEQRIEVYKRDNYTCQKCSVKCVSRRDATPKSFHQIIQCHHIVFWRETQDNSLSNLVTMCVTCHAKVHQKNTDEHEPT